MLPSLEHTFIVKEHLLDKQEEKFPETVIKGVNASDIGQTEKESSLCKGFADYYTNDKDSVFQKLSIKMKE